MPVIMQTLLALFLACFIAIIRVLPGDYWRLSIIMGYLLPIYPLYSMLVASQMILTQLPVELEEVPDTLGSNGTFSPYGAMVPLENMAICFTLFTIAILTILLGGCDRCCKWKPKQADQQQQQNQGQADEDVLV